MRIIVVGAGTVGSNIASHLVRDDHDVVIVDASAAKLRDVEEHVDVQTMVGNGCDPATLRAAMGGQETQLLLAVTEQDSTNLVMAYAAKRLGVGRVVARVRSRFFLYTDDVNFRDPLGIDLLLSPEILTALELVNFVENPAALGIAHLAQGRVQLRTVLLSPFSEFVSRRLMDIRFPPGMLVAVIRRGKKIFTPRGDAELMAGDHVTLVGLPAVIDEVHPQFDTEQKTSASHSQRVAIAGAGETGLFLAEQLEGRRHKVLLIDRNRERLEEIGERLNKTVLLHGDCTNIQFLREENVQEMDYFIAATGDEESNVMSALLASELKVPKTACLIDRPDYARVVEKVGINVALSPRIVAANRVLKLVKQGRIRSVTLMEEGAIEVTEYQALASSPITGKPLKEVELPEGMLIGAVAHGTEVIIPRGSDSIRPGDIVITVAEADASDSVGKLFHLESGDTK